MSAVVVPARQRPYGPPFRDGVEVLTLEVISALGDAVAVQQVAEMTTRLRFGISSASMVRWACTTPGEPYSPDRWYWPSDWDDLERCELAYALAPDWLQRRMAGQLLAFREHVTTACCYPRYRPDQFEAIL